MSFILYAGDTDAAEKIAKGADVAVQQSRDFSGLPDGDGCFVVACSPRQNEILSVYGSFGKPAIRFRGKLPKSVAKPGPKPQKRRK